MDESAARQVAWVARSAIGGAFVTCSLGLCSGTRHYRENPHLSQATVVRHFEKSSYTHAQPAQAASERG